MAHVDIQVVDRVLLRRAAPSPGVNPDERRASAPFARRGTPLETGPRKQGAGPRPEHLLKNEVYICRHGETEWSRSGQHTGKTDLPLTEAGEAAARKLGERLQRLSFDLVLTSPLKRAADTCAIAGFQAELEPALVEWDYGDYEGLTTPQIQEKVPDWNLFTHGVPNGETADQIEKRLDPLIQRLDETPGRILLFSSGHISRALGARWIGLTANDARRLSLSTASLSILGYIREDRALLLWNDTSHLL